MRSSSTPWWALLSSATAPVLLIGGWTLAASLQPDGYDSTVETISSLAGRGAVDRWVMTAALAGVGVCHLVTASGLRAAGVAGRVVLGLGGAATLLVAAFPLPAVGGSPAHTAAASTAFLALAAWPAVGWRRGADTPWALRPATSIAVALALLGLVAWFGASLSADARVGLAERVAAGAQAIWPFVGSGSDKRRRGGGRRR
jgi:hypothetical membrane protein